MESGRSSRTGDRCLGTSYAEPGPQTLQSIVIAALINYKSLLSDIGDVPIELLAPVFGAFSPEDLARVEDATARGQVGRDLKPFTWPCWYKHCSSLLERSVVCARENGSANISHELPPLPGASKAFLSPRSKSEQCEESVGVDEAETPEPADYRCALKPPLCRHHTAAWPWSLAVQQTWL